MLEIGLNVGIGTDGSASNNDLDMFEEVRLAAILGKGASGDPTAIPAQTALAMATRLGAQAIHMGHLIGSLEPGKRADLILIDINRLHNSPRFRRDPEGVYAQIIYAAKSTDVTDVMVNGKWLMRQQKLTTLQEAELIRQADEYARRMDTFLIQREQSVLAKLIAIGGALEGESFEVQAKVRISDPAPVLAALSKPDLEIQYHRHYHEFDTYFLFPEAEQGTVRYREDEFIDDGGGEISKVRYRLTLIGPTREHQFPSDILLSRSRFLAPAIHSLRFYREYFKPVAEIAIDKDRRRWKVAYKDTEFYINLDHLNKPELGYFLEVKSRTWSRRDAEYKATLMDELIRYLGASPESAVSEDYLEMVLNDKPFQL